jgi:hypothetical protein
MIHWHNLLKIAYDILEEANISIYDWTFGGGTALLYYYNHRESKDVDIFFHDSQLLTFVSPRLNSKAETVAENYTEQSNFVKIFINSHEIDFIVAPNLTMIEPNLVSINSMKLFIDNPVEIVAKKLFYRPESLKVRDIIDTVIVYLNNKDLVNILPSKKIKLDTDLIKRRVKVIKESDYSKTLKSLNLRIPNFNFEDCIKIFEKIINEVNHG